MNITFADAMFFLGMFGIGIIGIFAAIYYP